MTMLERATVQVHDRLRKGEFYGSSWDLAMQCGVSQEWLRAVLDHVRSPEFIEEHGWTIPFVRRGADMNTWFIADVGDTDDARMRASQHRRAREIERTTHRNVGQCRLAFAALPNKRSAHAKRWKRALVMLEATEVHVAALVESLNNETL